MTLRNPVNVGDTGHVLDHDTIHAFIDGNGTVAGSTQALGDAAIAGVAGVPADAGHKHGLPAMSTAETTTQAIGDTAVSGTSVKPAAGDHKHGMPVFAGTGAAVTPARSDHDHSGAYLPKTGVAATTQGLTVDDGTGQLVASLTSSEPQRIYGQANLTGLAPGNARAPIHVVAGSSGAVDDATHDYNLALFIENYTPNGAGVNITNKGNGDGLFGQTFGTGSSAILLNLWQGDGSHLTATGPAINIQRFGAGNALKINGQSGSGTADLIQVSNSANSTVLNLSTDTSTTADTVKLTRSGVTSGRFLNLFHATSAATGEGILMNVANTGGTWTGALLKLQRAGTSVMLVNSHGGLSVSTDDGSSALTVSNDSVGTTSNTVALTRTAVTSGNFINLFHSTSTYTGVPIAANMAGGSGTFTGKFITLGVNSAEKFSVDASGNVLVQLSQVVSTRKTGYTNAWTGTLERATALATGSVTLVALAQRVAAIQTDLVAHGLLGA